MWCAMGTRDGSLSPRQGRARFLAAAVAAFAAGSVTSVSTSRAHETPAESMPSPAVASRESARTASAGTLDGRVSALSKALDLDTRQRAELRKILENQREAVRTIWSDRSLLDAERVPATRAVEDRTADQIRAILTEEQKKKYNPPKPAPAPAPRSAPPDVAAWMEAARPK